jgi:hypothetical protein
MRKVFDLVDAFGEEFKSWGSVENEITAWAGEE